MNPTTLTAAAEQILSYVLLTKDARPLKALRDYLTLHTPVPLESYAPAAVLSGWIQPQESERIVVLPADIESKAVGNPDRIALCLQIFLDNLHFGPDTVLEIRLTEKKHTVGTAPCLQCTFQGPGLVPPNLFLNHFFRLPIAAFSDCWTRATRDGRVDVTPQGATLWLQGARQAPSQFPEAATLLDLLAEVDPAQAAARALAWIDGKELSQPLSLMRTLQEVLEMRQQEFQAAGMAATMSELTPTPQLLLKRGRIQALAHALCDYTLWHVPSGAQLELELSFDVPQRTVQLQANITAADTQFQESFHIAPLQRAVAEHKGTLELLPDHGQAIITVHLPDVVAVRLDSWLPGWDKFSQRSQQMLRLLKTGAPAPPKDFILAGVLEDELERRLLPRLELPAARNLAKEIEGSAGKQAYTLPERATKALAQVSRGKPKKEIAQPVYAAELLHAFSKTERGRGILNLDLPAEELEALKQALTATPPAAREALQTIAKWTP